MFSFKLICIQFHVPFLHNLRDRINVNCERSWLLTTSKHLNTLSPNNYGAEQQEQGEEQVSSLERVRMPSSPVIGIPASRVFAVLSLTAFWRHLLSVFPLLLPH